MFNGTVVLGKIMKFDSGKTGNIFGRSSFFIQFKL